MSIVIGVDEVGRGSLVGNVTCCAYIHNTNYNKIIDVTDSKKLSSIKRNKLESEIINNGYYFISEMDEKTIDKINILNCTMLCMQHCLVSLIYNHIEQYNNIKIYIDGNHNPFALKFCDKKLNEYMYDTLSDIEKQIYNFLKTNSSIIECVIKGDAKIYEIGCASILAKEFRDKQMFTLHQLFPIYEWNKNMGYGTQKHINTIQQHGFTLLHRITFIKKFII